MVFTQINKSLTHNKKLVILEVRLLNQLLRKEWELFCNTVMTDHEWQTINI